MPHTPSLFFAKVLLLYLQNKHYKKNPLHSLRFPLSLCFIFLLLRTKKKKKPIMTFSSEEYCLLFLPNFLFSGFFSPFPFSFLPFSFLLFSFLPKNILSVQFWPFQSEVQVHWLGPLHVPPFKHCWSHLTIIKILLHMISPFRRQEKRERINKMEIGRE